MIVYKKENAYSFHIDFYKPRNYHDYREPLDRFISKFDYDSFKNSKPNAKIEGMFKSFRNKEGWIKHKNKRINKIFLLDKDDYVFGYVDRKLIYHIHQKFFLNIIQLFR